MPNAGEKAAMQSRLWARHTPPSNLVPVGTHVPPTIAGDAAAAFEEDDLKDEQGQGLPASRAQTASLFMRMLLNMDLGGNGSIASGNGWKQVAYEPENRTGLLCAVSMFHKGPKCLVLFSGARTIVRQLKDTRTSARSLVGIAHAYADKELCEVNSHLALQPLCTAYSQIRPALQQTCAGRAVVAAGFSYGGTLAQMAQLYGDAEEAWGIGSAPGFARCADAPARSALFSVKHDGNLDMVSSQKSSAFFDVQQCARLRYELRNESTWDGSRVVRRIYGWQETVATPSLSLSAEPTPRPMPRDWPRFPAELLVKAARETVGYELDPGDSESKAEHPNPKFYTHDAGIYNVILRVVGEPPPQPQSRLDPAHEFEVFVQASTQQRAHTVVAQYAAPASYVRRFSNLSSSVRRWTRLHGYDYALRTRGFDLRDNDARWQKYPLLVMLLEGGYERVVFIDYDALVFRHDLPADFFFERHKADVILSAQSSFFDQDHWAYRAGTTVMMGANTSASSGLLLIRNTPFVRDFLLELMRDDCGVKHALVNLAEETCLNSAAGFLENPQRFAVVPMGELQCEPLFHRIMTGLSKPVQAVAPSLTNWTEPKCDRPLVFHGWGVEAIKAGVLALAALQERDGPAPTLDYPPSVQASMERICIEGLPLSAPADADSLCEYCLLLDHACSSASGDSSTLQRAKAVAEILKSGAGEALHRAHVWGGR